MINTFFQNRATVLEKAWPEIVDEKNNDTKDCQLQWKCSLLVRTCFIFRWDISVICPTVVLTLALKVFLAYIFKHSDWNDLIFFGHFKSVSVYDRKKMVKTSSKAEKTGLSNNAIWWMQQRISNCFSLRQWFSTWVRRSSFRGLTKVIWNMTIWLKVWDYCIIKYKLLNELISVTHFYFLLHWAKREFDKSLDICVRVRRVCKG